VPLIASYAAKAGCDELGEFLERIAVGVGAVLTAGVAVTVPADDASLFVTSRADCGLVEAG
jgi:hypothetical protein